MELHWISLELHWTVNETYCWDQAEAYRLFTVLKKEKVCNREIVIW